MNHAFNVYAAQEIGLHEAIILENLRFWCDKNRANEKNMYDGLTWTYNSVKAFSELFPYLSEKQIRKALKNLEDGGYVETGNYNTVKYDRTKWYAVTPKGYEILGSSILPEGQLHLAKRANGNTEKGEPIPDINTDIKPYIKPSLDNVLSFCSEHGISDVVGMKFYTYYNERSWCTNHQPIKDWQRLLLSWNSKEIHSVHENMERNAAKREIDMNDEYMQAFASIGAL